MYNYRPTTNHLEAVSQTECKYCLERMSKTILMREREREREIESRMKMGSTPMHMRDYFTLI